MNSELQIVNHYGTLSAAIRAGVKLAPAGKGSLIHWDAEELVFRTCALGAGLHAVFGRLPWNYEDTYGVVQELFPYVSTIVSCPEKYCEYSHVPREVYSIVWLLNDIHEWTREKIADWLEEYENSIGYETLIEKEVPDEQPATLLLQQEAALSG